MRPGEKRRHWPEAEIDELHRIARLNQDRILRGFDTLSLGRPRKFAAETGRTYSAVKMKAFRVQARSQSRRPAAGRKQDGDRVQGFCANCCKFTSLLTDNLCSDCHPLKLF